MSKPKVLVLRAAGTNCDVETAFAFELAGAESRLVHVKRLIEGSVKLLDFDILAIPGGFSYGDDISAGKVLAVELTKRLGEELREFVGRSRPVLGICNGFQVLVKMGLLGGGDSTLASNDSQKFEDRWVFLAPEKTDCIWTQGLGPTITLPVAHAEGKFVYDEKQFQVAFRYVERDGSPAGYPANPNGSVEGIAGVSDPTGLILGLMPHPERHILPHQHPRWTREGLKERPAGLSIIENGVRSGG